MSFKDEMQVCTFKGIRIEVREIRQNADRRVVVKVFPYSDRVETEDMGRRPTVISVEGFLAGDDVLADRAQLESITGSTKDAGMFVHPTQGTVKAVLLSATFLEGTNDGWRFIRVRLELIEVGDERSLASTISGLGSAQSITNAAAEVSAATSDDFFDTISNGVKTAYATIKAGASDVRASTSVVNGFVNNVTSYVGDASSLVRSVDGVASILTGHTGSRYANSPIGRALGNVTATLSGIDGGVSDVSKITQGTQRMMNASSKNLQNVTDLSNKVSRLAGLL